MPTTPILGITQVSTSQNGKETTINDAIVALENATNAKLAVSMAAGNVTLSVPEATRNFIFTAAGATAARELIFPTEVNGNPYDRVIVVRNLSGHGLTVRFASGGGDTVTIPNGESRLISAADGLDMSVAAEPPSVITFLSLTDAPETYTGQTGKFLSVNDTETALEFTDAAVFPTLVGNANRFLRVNAGATGVEWAVVDFAGTFTELTDTPASYAGQGGKLVRVNDLATGLEFVDATDAEAVNFQLASRWRLLLLEPGIWPENPPGVGPGDPEFIEQTDQVGFGEIEFLDQDDVDLTGGGTASASNFLTGNEPSRAFNNLTTPADGWLTEETFVGAVWIEYDFGAPVSPRRVRLSSINTFPQYGPSRFLIQYWDGSAWISLGDRSPAPWATTTTQTFKINGIPLDVLEEAPANGSLYGRKDGEWFKINSEVVSDNTTTSNLDATQTFQYRRYINAGTKILNIRANVDHPMPADGEWYIYNANGAALTITPAVGVTVNAPAEGSLIVPLNGTVRIKRIAVDVYDVFGDTVSSGAIGGEEIPSIIGNASKILAVKSDASGLEWIAQAVPYSDENARDAIAAALVAGTNVTITNNDAANTITISAASIGLNAEEVRDTIGAALRAGTNMSWSINDTGDTITVSTSALDAEGVRDTIGAALVAGANIAISVNDTANTIAVAATMDQEVIRDTIADALVAGSNIIITHDDVANTITIDSLGGGGGGGLDAEAVRDVVGAALVAGSNITINVNDAADTITIDSATDPEVVRDTIASALVAGSNVTITNNDGANTITFAVTMDQEVIRDTIGATLVAGANVTITADDAANTITIASTGGGGGGTDPEVVRDTIAAALVAGANVTITPNDLGDTITIAASGGLDAEAVRDTIGSALVAGTNVTIDVNDAANTITINSATNAETIRDTMATALVAGSNVTITPNDAADTITIAAATDQEVVRDTVATALVAGPNVTITVNDAADTITIEAENAANDPEFIRDTIADALLAGDNVTIVHNDFDNTITISSTGGGGGGGGGGGVGLITPTIRTTPTPLSFNSASQVVDIPPSAVVGDAMFLFCSHGFEAITPTGWLELFRDTTTLQVRGAIFLRILTSGDITAGTVTVTFAGSFNGVIQPVVIEGDTISSIRDIQTVASGTGSTTMPLIAYPNETDLVLGFAANRATSNNTLDSPWVTLRSLNAASASSVFGRISNPDYVVTTPATASSAGSGYFTATVVLGGKQTRTTGFYAITEIATTLYDLDTNDAGSYLRFTAATAKTMSVRADATHALLDDSEWHIRNAGAGNLTLSPAGGVTITPPAGGSLIIPPDGVATLKRIAVDTFDLMGTTVSEAVGVPYALPFGFVAKPLGNATVLIHVFTEDVLFAADFALSRGGVATNPTATASLSIRKNGSAVGGIGITTGGVVSFFTSGGTPVSFVAGDVLTVVAQDPADLTLANSAFTLRGTRT
jgi:hypothetical protein